MSELFAQYSHLLLVHHLTNVLLHFEHAEMGLDLVIDHLFPLVVLRHIIKVMMKIILLGGTRLRLRQAAAVLVENTCTNKIAENKAGTSWLRLFMLFHDRAE